MIELHHDALSGEGVVSEISLAFHRGTQGFAGLRETWRQIENSLAGKRFFHLYPRYRACLENLEQNPDSVIFCVILRGISPVAVFPLKITTQKVCGIPLRVLQIPTHDHLDLSDFIFAKTGENATLLKELVHQLRQTPGIAWDMIYIPGALEDSVTAFALQYAPPPYGAPLLSIKAIM